MKNLFKNLMLVAVAAMAFTACQNDNNEVNEVAKKTVISGVLSFDEGTRSGFVGTETTDNGDGTNTTVYKSAWDDGDKIKLFAENGLETTATVDAEGKFTAEFEGQLPESFFMTIVSPADSWSDKDFSTIPAEQTPRANSVDPLAHILKAQNVQVTNGSADAANMGHEVAYGKMTVNGVDFDIDHVVVNLKGTYYMNYERECTYTINADNVQNNVFWFTTETFENVTEFTVTAYDAEGKSVAKTVDVAAAEKTLSFNYGRVSTFSVSGLEEPKVVYDYTTAYVSKTWGDTDKLITFTAEGKDILNVNFAGRSFDGNAIAAGTYYYGDGVYSYGISFGDYSGSVVSVNSLGSVVVSVVDGCYLMEFNGLKLPDGSVIERITFKGTIEGLDVPDSRTRLATPEVTYELNGKTLTVSWTPVDGAVGYYVHDYYYDVDTTTTDTTLTVELTEYKWYYIYVSALAATDDANFKNSAEGEVSFELKDPRTVLSAPTNIVATVDGKYATISWDKVEGADYYYVEYYMDGTQSTEVTDTSVTLEIGYSKSIWVYVLSKANDDNPDYKSSTSWDCYVQVNTGKDPNVFADYIFDTLAWNSQYSRFELSGNGNGMTQFYVNSSDSPNNNSIKVGTYTYAGNTVSNPGVGTFSLRYLLGTGAGNSHYVYDATMSVAFENDQYIILITINNAGNSNVVGKTFGYKGMPYGWVAPSEGDDSGDDNTGDDNTGDDNTGEDGDDNTGEDFSNWSFSASINQDNNVLKLTDGTRTVEMTLNELVFTSFYADSSKSNYFTNVKVDGVSKTATADSYVTLVRSGWSYSCTISLTINGVPYTGSGSLTF